MFERDKNTRGNGRKLTLIIFAACLIFALAITAYAANLFRIQDMFRTDRQELPEAATEFIRQETASAEGEDWSCTITESLSDDSTVMATLRVSGGDKYIIAPTDANPEDSVALVGLPGDQTLGQLAQAQGKKLLLVSARLSEIGGKNVPVGWEKPESISEKEMMILVQGTRTAPGTNQEAVCRVAGVEAGTDEVKHMELRFMLEEAPAVQGERVYHPINPDAVSGMHFGDLTATESALGINIHIVENITNLEEAYNVMKVEMDGLEYGEGGSILGDDGNWFFRANMCKGTIGDTIIVRYYDWDKVPIGEVEFKIVQ